MQEEQPVKRKYKKSTIINEVLSADKPKSDKKDHYVDNAEFYKAMVERKKLYNDWIAAGSVGLKPQISNYIGQCITDIAHGLSRKYQFANYRYKDEMVADAVEHCIRYIDSFNPDVSKNPFSYYTQTCYFQFLNIIKSEQKEQYIKYKAILNSITFGDLATLSEDADAASEHMFDNLDFDVSFMEKFVETYEARKAAKKEEQDEKVAKKGLDLFTADLEEGITE